MRPDTVIIVSSLNPGVIATDNTHDIHVWGVLKGELTICSGRNLYIEDDVIYNGGLGPAGSPVFGVPSSCTDYLGLVARNNIILAYSNPSSALPDTTDPNQVDCGVNASILAYNSFLAQNYNQPTTGIWPRGTLYVVGSVVQNTRGNLGVLMSSSPFRAAGYVTKNLTYDSRLATHMPPYFPLYDQQRILAWIE
jgi:hypothetical protein